MYVLEVCEKAKPGNGVYTQTLPLTYHLISRCFFFTRKWFVLFVVCQLYVTLFVLGHCSSDFCFVVFWYVAYFCILLFVLSFLFCLFLFVVCCILLFESWCFCFL